MTDEPSTPLVAADTAMASEVEVFELEARPVAYPMDLFELSFPRPPQGAWRDKFDIRADVRFAYMDLVFDQVTVRVSTRRARLNSSCRGCFLLPHSLYGLNPLPARNVIAVQEKQTEELMGSAAVAVQSKASISQGFDAGMSVEGKASGEAARRVERQAKHVGKSNEIAIELSIEIQPKDLVFRKVSDESNERSRRWFKRNQINTELIARRLVELAYGGAGASNSSEQAKIVLGTATLQGRRKVLLEKPK